VRAEPATYFNDPGGTWRRSYCFTIAAQDNRRHRQLAYECVVPARIFLPVQNAVVLHEQQMTLLGEVEVTGPTDIASRPTESPGSTRRTASIKCERLALHVSSSDYVFSEALQATELDATTTERDADKLCNIAPLRWKHHQP
jgi:hypothetical protein